MMRGCPTFNENRCGILHRFIAKLLCAEVLR
jgi:hypothetical protein